MNYTLDLEFITTKDGIELPGLFYKPKKGDKKMAIIFIHGLSSTFYNPKVKKFGEVFTKKGYSFLAFNTRGGGIITSFRKMDKRKKKSYRYMTIGSGYENFSQSLFDLAAMVNYARKKGFKKVFLLGHSTGANKSAYFGLKARKPKVDGVILLAPIADRPSNWKNRRKNNFEILFKKAESLVKKGLGRTLLPIDVVKGFVSAERYLSLNTIGSDEDVFSYHHKEQKLTSFKKFRLPLMVIHAEKDEHLAGYRAKNLLKLFEKNAINSKYYEGVLIKGGTHSFSGKENLVARKIVGFIHKTYRRI